MAVNDCWYALLRHTTAQSEQTDRNDNNSFQHSHGVHFCHNYLNHILLLCGLVVMMSPKRIFDPNRVIDIIGA